MSEIEKSAKAKNDLIDIWIYSANEWGVKQADTYLDALDGGIQNIAINPEIGRSREALRVGYKALHIRHHVVFYTVKSSSVYIIRILHERMDVDQHL